jgi:hypothetical protein
VPLRPSYHATSPFRVEVCNDSQPQGPGLFRSRLYVQETLHGPRSAMMEDSQNPLRVT